MDTGGLLERIKLIEQQLADLAKKQGGGSSGSNSFIPNEVPSGLVNGTNTVFTLAYTPITNSLLLTLDGVLQKGGGNDYTLVDNTITFVDAPETGSNLLAFYQSTVVTSGNADTLDGQHGSFYAPASQSARLRVYLGTTQLNVTDVSLTNILLDTEEYDTGNNFASNMFTAPVSGYYLMAGQIRYTSVIADKQYACQIRQNGGADKIYSQGLQHASNTADLTVSTTTVSYLEAGTVVRLVSYLNVGANTVDVLAGLWSTYLSIHLLST